MTDCTERRQAKPDDDAGDGREAGPKRISAHGRFRAVV
jgi:hypothetical protein